MSMLLLSYYSILSFISPYLSKNLNLLYGDFLNLYSLLRFAGCSSLYELWCEYGRVLL